MWGMTKKTCANWPLVKKLFETNYISHIDYVLAYQLLSKISEAPEELAIFICYLSLAQRQGHLCVYISENHIYPDIKDLWPKSNEESLDINTHNLLQNHLLKILENPLLEQLKTVICQKGPLFYFKRNYLCEQIIKERFELLQASPLSDLNQKAIEAFLEQEKAAGRLLPEQAQAILMACSKSIVFITGGPGTGKTYTAAKLVQAYLVGLSDRQRNSCRIGLAAPTGKAAANLQASMSKVLDKNHLEMLSAITLHALLGIKRSLAQASQQLHFDLLIIDESSMIDADLMHALLKSVQPGTRLVFLGDPNQLPAVSSGALFADLTEAYPEHVGKLATCLRTDLADIVAIGKGIINGDKSLFTHPTANVQRHSLTANANPVLNQKKLVERLLPYYTQESFRVLTPMRQGLFGIEQLNEKFYLSLLKNYKNDQWMPIPIIITQTNHDVELYNGETGILHKKVGAGSLQEDYAMFQNRKIPALLLPSFEYAYCMSVHKSQGSEFDHVVLIMPEGAHVFGREVLYTAATRARKRFEIYVDDSVLTNCLARKSYRLSGFKTFCFTSKSAKTSSAKGSA